jgi:phycobilisome core-membrane linker protein
VKDDRSIADIEFRSNQGVTKKREQTKTFKLTQAGDPVQLKNVVRAAYRQVFERDIEPYIVDNEFTALVSKLANREINLKEFIEGLGGSKLYIKEFYTPYPNTKVIELGTKHFLGRAPLDQAEIRKYNKILASDGIKAFVNAMVNSAEYLQAFGEDVVPYNRFLTLPAANYPNTQTLYNKLTKQDSTVVVPSFDTIKPRMDGSKLPLMGKAMADNAAKAAQLVQLGRSIGNATDYVPQNKSARVFRFNLALGTAEQNQAIDAAYQQTMAYGNDELLPAMRQLELEGKLRTGEISMRQFVRGIVCSEFYQQRFDAAYPNRKTIEFLYRHLLGRTATADEAIESEQLLTGEGLSAVVNTLVDGNEYLRYFGEDVVPYNR